MISIEMHGLDACSDLRCELCEAHLVEAELDATTLDARDDAR